MPSAAPLVAGWGRLLNLPGPFSSAGQGYPQFGPGTRLAVRVSLALGAEPSDPSTWTWTDITSYVMYRGPVTITRGRRDEQSTAGPTSCTFTLKNPGGIFTPRKADSPFYGVLAVNTPVRVEVNFGSGWNTRFTGYLSERPPRSDVSERDQYVPVRADGVLRRLGQGDSPLYSPIFRGITRTNAFNDVSAGSLLAYWPCEDGSNAAGTIASGIPGRPDMGVPGTGISFASYEGLRGSKPLPTLANTCSLVGRVVSYTSTGTISLHMFMFIPVGGLTDGVYLADVHQAGGGSVGQWSIRYSTGASGSLALESRDAAGTTIDTSGAQWFGVNGVGFELAFDVVQSGSDAAYVIVTRAIGPYGVVSTTTFNSSFAGRTVGAATEIVVGAGGSMPAAAVGHIVVASTNQVHYADNTAVLQGYFGETAGNRFIRMCSEENVPYAINGDASSTKVMGWQPSDTLVNILRECEAADAGLLDEDAYGNLRLNALAQRYNQDVALALDAAAGQVAPPLDGTDDDQLIRNDVVVTRKTGGTGYFADPDPYDPTSIGSPMGVSAVGRYAQAVTLNVAYDGQNLQDQAAWRVHIGTVDEMRYPTISLNLTRNPGLAQQWVACDIGSRVTISNPPSDLPPDVIDQLIEGYTETIDPVMWTVELNCAPAAPYRVTEANDDVLGRPPPARSYLATDATTSDASLSVASYTGTTLWSTDSADYPLDIRINGEVMRVTAVSGASSPQTFTVTRSINGVSRAHVGGDATTGSDVTLAYEPAIAL